MTPFAAWYRKHYLLVTVPILFVVVEVILTVWDPVRKNELDPFSQALADVRARPANERPVVLFIGNSAMKMGIEPALFESELSGQHLSYAVYNFGLASTSALDLNDILANVRSAGIRPNVIVVGVNLYLFDSRVHVDSRLPWVDRRSPYIFFHRSLLRRRLKGVVRKNVDAGGELGIGVSDGIQNDAQRAFNTAAFLREFGDQNADAFPLFQTLKAFFASVERDHIPCFAVLLPQNSDGTAKLATFPELMRRLRDAVTVERLDVSDTYPFTEFIDVGHLNSAGRARLTKEVASWLGPKLRTQP